MPHHRRHLGRDVRVRHGVGHDVGRFQLEAQLSLVRRFVSTLENDEQNPQAIIESNGTQIGDARR